MIQAGTNNAGVSETGIIEASALATAMAIDLMALEFLFLLASAGTSHQSPVFILKIPLYLNKN